MPSPQRSAIPKHAYRGNPLADAAPAELAQILDRHRGEPDALITALEEIQRHYGYLGRNHLQMTARELHFPLARVYGVATFYNLFIFEPPGKYQVRVCRGTACHVNHSDAILTSLEQHLGIGVDETTPDRRVTLQTVACMGACSLAPVVVINNETHGRMTPEAAWRMLACLDDGASQPTQPQNGDAA
jgi:NADH-quinone oxidoreductase subunit E